MANTPSTASKSTLKRFSTIQTDPLRNFRFIVDFTTTEGATVDAPLKFSGGFTSVSGLSVSTNAIGYREGGMNTTLHQIPGMTSFSPITLTRGVIYGQDQSINWMKSLFAAVSGEGVPLTAGQTFRCNLTIYVLDHPMVGAPLLDGDVISDKAYKMKINVYNAFITTLNFTDLNAQGNEVMMETITLAHEGLSFTLAADGVTL